MTFDRDFAEVLIDAMVQTGWNAVLPDEELPNPLDVKFTGQDKTLRLIVHARRITPQSRSGTSPSTHNRPIGEMHSQMIFDGDKRGRGVRNHLRFAENAETVLFGFYPVGNSGYVIAAYDPERHSEYAYSQSLQIKREVIEKALKVGFAHQIRTNGETIVVFYISEIAEYLENAQNFHNLSAILRPDMLDDSPPSLDVKRVIDETATLENLPQLAAKERKQIVSEVVRYVRDRNFSKGIKEIYERCAICGFQYDYVLDAAHIVPVAEGGTDTYDNGLGLCPNCHRMYDKGFILVDKTGEIYINLRHAEEYDQMGRADSLEDLRTTLRESLWLPEDERYRPSPENLRRTFKARR